MANIFLFLCLFYQNNTVSIRPYIFTEFPSKSSDPVDYIIITNDELEPAYEILAEWKREKGITCIVKTINWITQNYQGSDTPDKIRNFLKSAHENWSTEWALMGGDPDIVPIRQVVSKNNYPPFYLISSDLYYSALNTTWNADGDNFWGESVVDSMDFTPIIWVGRLPGSSITETENLIDKVIEYEKSPNIGCLERLLVLTSRSDAPYGRAIAGCFPNYFEVDTLWGAAKQAIIDSMAKGYGFLYGTFHGSSTQNWSSDGGGNLGRNDVDNLTSYIYSIVTITCYTHWVDIDCLSRHFMMNPSISCLGSSRVGWFSEETRLNCEFYHAIFDSSFQIGKALAWAKAKIVPEIYLGGVEKDGNYRDVLLSYVLYGEPTTRFWTKKPGSLQVIHPLSIKPGEKQFMVTVNDQTSYPIQNALVCIYKEDEVYARGYSNALGEINFSLTTETSGLLTLTVTKPDFFPLQDSILVLPDCPYVKYQSYTLDVGQDAEAGDSIILSLSLKNTGMGTASSASAKLVTNSPYLTLINDSCYYGDIAEQETKSRDYKIKIDTLCTDSMADFHVFIYHSADSSRDTFNLPIKAPVLSHYSHFIDSLNNISIKINNLGNGEATLVNAKLSTITAGVSITDSVENLGNIPPLQISEFLNCFSFDTTFLSPVFIIELTDSLSRKWCDTFACNIISPPTNFYTNSKSFSLVVGWDKVANARGYNVYKAPDTTLLNPHLITNIYCWEDKPLLPYTVYSYWVTSVDSFLNESSLSSQISGRCNPAIKSGWPKIGNNIYVNSPVAADLMPDVSGLEIIANTATDDKIYAWYISGTGIFSTDGSFASDMGTSFTNPLVADINGDKCLDIIRTESWVNDLRMWVLERNGTMHPNFPVQLTNSVWWATFFSPCVQDLDKDGNLEILVVTAGTNNKGKLFIFRENGDGFTNPDGVFFNYDSLVGVVGSTFGLAPAVADIDGDDTLDIVVGFADTLYVLEPTGAPMLGWPVKINGATSCPAVGDLDTAYQGLEIVVHTSKNLVYVYHADGTIVNNWPQPCITSPYTMSSPSLGDVNGDGLLEIALGGIDSYYLWNWDATIPSGWPVSLPLMHNVSPVTPILADVDGDDEIEYIGASLLDGNIYAFNGDGTMTAGFPIASNGRIEATPLVADVDFDDANELVAVTRDFAVYIWELEGNKIEWGGFGHDRWHTGCHGFIPYDTLILGAEEQPKEICFNLMQNNPNPFLGATSIYYSIGKEVENVKISIYDASGRNIKNLLNESNVKPGVYNLTWNGKSNYGKKVPAGIYFYKLTAGKFKDTKKLILLK